MPDGLTRGQFLAAAGGAAAGLLFPAASEGATRGGGSGERSFHTQPGFHIPPITATRTHRAAAHVGDGYWFLTPGGDALQTGPMIIDGRGRMVWYKPLHRELVAMDFRVQHYRGEPVLTWWEGTLLGFRGEGVIMDTSYREIARVQAGNGLRVDPHEFLLTPEGTALITCSPATVSADLRPVGGDRHGQLYESVVQEVDVATGRVLFEWRSLSHVAISESYMQPGGVYDYFHANSIDVTPDGNLMVSGRHTWAVYKLNRRTGEVMWRLGGKRSDFALDGGARFAWQHDVKQRGPGQITVFDNGAAAFFFSKWRNTHSQSRGLVLEVDESRRRARLARAYKHDPGLLTTGYGSVQTLPRGGVVIGWGDLPHFSQYTTGGVLVEEISLPLGYASYRAFRLPWQGHPEVPPVLAARRHRKRGATELLMSWNGATHLASWAVKTGPNPHALRRTATVKRDGFETGVRVPLLSGHASATALDHAGRPLASTPVIKL